jgi:hypothetical protein
MPEQKRYKYLIAKVKKSMIVMKIPHLVVTLTVEIDYASIINPHYYRIDLEFSHYEQKFSYLLSKKVNICRKIISRKGSIFISMKLT